MSGELVVAEVIEGVSPPELALVANREHALARQAGTAMVEHAIRAGGALAKAKVKVDHGDWLPWLQSNVDAAERTVQLYMHLASNAQRIADLDLWTLGLNAIQKRLRRIDRESQDGDSAGLAPDYRHDLRHGDFREVLDDLYGEVDAVITDPPYPAEFVEEFDALGEYAARLLRPSGLLVAMVGQTHLPAYLERLGQHLTYRWCGAYLTDGPATRIHGRKVGTKWKPLLIYGGDDFITQDVFSSQADDKQHHHWGQSESGFADIVERLTEPGQLVVDPFLGGGTTAVVCQALGRRFVGCDVDQRAIQTTNKRLAA